MSMHDIDLDRAEQKICLDFFDELCMEGKPEKLNKVGHSTVYSMDESEEDEEAVEMTVLGDGGGDVSIVPVVYPCGAVSVSLLGYFSYIGSSSKLSSKPSYPYLPVSIVARHI